MRGITVSVSLPVSLVRPGNSDDPMLCASTNLRTRVVIRSRSAHDQKSLKKISQKVIDGLGRKYPEIKQRGWGISVIGNRPETASANIAVLVGTIGGMLYAHRRIWNPLSIQEIAYSIVKNDYKEAPAMVAACVAGGIIWSRRELPFLVSTWQLPIRLQPSTQRFSISFVNDGDVVHRQRLKSRNKNHEQEVRAIAVALKHGDVQTLRTYYQDKVESSSCDTVLRYEPINTYGYQAIMIGGDGIRLEPK